ncbi:MAG: hypothetical protein PVH41_17025 [Anaerolineae bacterium]
MSKKSRDLFLCIENRARSQMDETHPGQARVSRAVGSGRGEPR